MLSVAEIKRNIIAKLQFFETYRSALLSININTLLLTKKKKTLSVSKCKIDKNNFCKLLLLCIHCQLSRNIFNSLIKFPFKMQQQTNLNNFQQYNMLYMQITPWRRTYFY